MTSGVCPFAANKKRNHHVADEKSTKGSKLNVSSAPSAALREQILPNAVYLTDEAAAVIRVRPSTIRTAVRLGRIRARGKPFRILGSELLKFAS